MLPGERLLWTERPVRALRLKPDELRRTWAAYLDQLAEPAVVPQRDGTADLTLRAREKFSLSMLANGGPLPRAFTPGMQPSFPVLRGLPDAELARQVISTGRQRMRQGALDVPPVDARPGTAEHAGFVPAPAPPSSPNARAPGGGAIPPSSGSRPVRGSR